MEASLNGVMLYQSSHVLQVPFNLAYLACLPVRSLSFKQIVSTVVLIHPDRRTSHGQLAELTQQPVKTKPIRDRIPHQGEFAGERSVNSSSQLCVDGLGITCCCEGYRYLLQAGQASHGSASATGRL